MEHESSDDQPECAFVGQVRVSQIVDDPAGTIKQRIDIGREPTFSWNGRKTFLKSKFMAELHLDHDAGT